MGLFFKKLSNLSHGAGASGKEEQGLLENFFTRKANEEESHPRIKCLLRLRRLKALVKKRFHRNTQNTTAVDFHHEDVVDEAAPAPVPTVPEKGPQPPPSVKPGNGMEKLLIAPLPKTAKQMPLAPPLPNICLCDCNSPRELLFSRTVLHVIPEEGSSGTSGWDAYQNSDTRPQTPEVGSSPNGNELLPHEKAFRQQLEEATKRLIERINGEKDPKGDDGNSTYSNFSEGSDGSSTIVDSANLHSPQSYENLITHLGDSGDIEYLGYGDF